MDELSLITETVLSLIKEKMNFNDSSFNLWFGDLKLISLNEEKAVFTTPTSLRKSILLSKHKNLIKSILEEVIGFEIDIEIESVQKNSDVFKKPLKEDDPPKPDEETDKRRIVIENFLSEPSEKSVIKEYTFDNFIEGSSNKFAKNACYAVAETPSAVYNPLFIYGNSGLGKTHLLYAIINHIKEHHPKLNIVYKKSEDFINELILSIKEGDTSPFKEKYRKTDVLLIDDIQFISGKESTQEEFFHTFSALYEADKQIIITSDRPPKEIKPLDDRLRTRFEGSLLADIQKPSFELRIAIIRKKADSMGLLISNELVDYMAERLHHDIRQIEGVLKRIYAVYSLTGTSISKESIDQAISAIDPGNIPTDALVEKIISTVSKNYGVSVELIKSKRRQDYIVKPRQISIYLIRELSSISYKSIGEIFDIHHASVIASYNKVDQDLKTRADLRTNVQTLIKQIKG